MTTSQQATVAARAREIYDRAAKAAAIKLRAERRAGELLADVTGGEHGGDRKSSCAVQLDDIGIKKHESHRWQTIAATPEEEFEEFIGDSIAGRKELTSKAAYRLGKQHKAKPEPVDSVAIVNR